MTFKGMKDRLTDAAHGVGAAAKQAVSTVANAATTAAGFVESYGQAAFDAARNAPEATKGAFTKHLHSLEGEEVPVFIVPQKPGWFKTYDPEGYIIHLDMHAYQAALKRSWLTQPQLVVYAPAVTFDRDVFAKRLWTELDDALTSARRAVDRSNRQAKSVATDITVGLFIAALEGAALAPMLPILIAVWFLATSGAEKVQLAKSLAHLIWSVTFGKHDHTVLNELEASLKKSLAKIEIHVHQGLQAKAESYGAEKYTSEMVYKPQLPAGI